MKMNIAESTIARLPYWGQIEKLGSEEKHQLIKLIYASMGGKEHEEEQDLCSGQRERDEQLVKDLHALRYDGEMTAEELKTLLRESRHGGERNIKYAFEYEEEV